MGRSELMGFYGMISNAGVMFKPGDRVLQSGIYDVVHCPPHTASDHHQVTCVRGEPFPPCRDCKTGVKYKLFRAAYHLSDHPHLARTMRPFGPVTR